MAFKHLKLYFIFTLLCIVTLSLFANQSTLAFLHDNTNQPNTSFSAGNLRFFVNNEKISFTDSTGSLNIPISNLAPGDKGTETFDLHNEGTIHLKYDVSGGVENGPIPFVGVDPDQDLRVTYAYSTDNGVNWVGFIPGDNNIILPTGSMHKFKVNYEVPLRANDRYQGASGILHLRFRAEQFVLGDDCFLPPFSNRNFTLHQGSLVPIKFEAHGSQDDDQVRLEITGPGVSGGMVKYVFTQSNGNLEKNGNHYQAQFSTRDYVVVTNGTYKATVFLGDTPICEKSFVVLEQGNRSNSPNQ